MAVHDSLALKYDRETLTATAERKKSMTQKKE